MSLSSTLYLVAVALCIFCTGFTTRAARGKPLTYFTAFLLLQSAVFLFELLISHPATPFKAVWLALLMSTSLLLAPCLWLTFRQSIVGENPALPALPRTHSRAVLAGALFTVPLALSAHGGTTFWNPAEPSSWLESKIIHTTMLLCIGVFVVQVPWYLLRCRQMLLAKARRSRWAELPLAIVATTWGLAIVRTIDCAFMKWPPTFSLVVAVISVGVTVGALYLLLRQYGGADSENESYAKSPLPAPLRQRIQRKLEATSADVYMRGDLSLRTLSESLNESPHYVSQVISQDLNTSFHELVNTHRIREAQRLLRDSPDETVLSIAMNVGFNSKSAFHTAFRRVTGMTPGDFRRH